MLRAGTCEQHEEDAVFMQRKEREFDAQATFVEQLTQISEQMRHVIPVSKRDDALQRRLLELQQTCDQLTGSSLPWAKGKPASTPLWFPLTCAGETTPKEILRVLPLEGKVFSTRERAPTMIVFEACNPRSPSLAVDLTRCGTGLSEAETETESNPASSSGSSLSLVSSSSSSSSVSSVRDPMTDPIPDKLHVPAPPPIGLRRLDRQDSHMLDVMLCGLDNQDDEVDDAGSSSCPISEDGSESRDWQEKQIEMNEDGDNDSNNSPDSSAPPIEFLEEDAREQFEDSVIGAYISSFHASVRAQNEDDDEEKNRAPTWQRKCDAHRGTSDFASLSGWTLTSLIAKSNDDLRQEVFALQLMRTLLDIFRANQLEELYLRPYQIVCTGANIGLIETLRDSQSLDSVKKQYGSLAEYFTALFGAEEMSPARVCARDAFITSMAASSIFCYLFQIKDRHNGNIMMDQEGHILHIDFGFMLGLRPGGAVGLEKHVPFKLTAEMVELMGGVKSPGYDRFRKLFLQGFLAVRREYIKLATILHLSTQNSPLPCFQAKKPVNILRAFRERLFHHEENDEVAKALILRLVDKSLNNWRTRKYDSFQLKSNGILP
ncbi:hypothetical protein PINS_up001560 [Pythium insidiosum]|nr:hypothetical protein PINS_up001560 [Pythium insidiosum]